MLDNRLIARDFVVRNTFPELGKVSVLILQNYNIFYELDASMTRLVGDCRTE